MKFQNHKKRSGWSNTVSHVKVEAGCRLVGYKQVNFQGEELQTWIAKNNVTLEKDLLSKYEDNKMKSFKCSCAPQTCEGLYTYGNGYKFPKGCRLPSCGVATTDMCDSWRKLVSFKF